MKLLMTAACAASTLFAAMAPAHASVLDHVQIKLGVSVLAPDDSASTSIGGDVDISDATVPSLQLEYFLNDTWSVELLCCIATHDVGAVDTAAGDVDLGEVTHFPPTLTVKHRWTGFGAFEPYVGAGVNYTAFIDEELPSPGAVAVNSISYGESWGPAVQIGFDYRIDEHWAVNLDVRRIWINTDVDMTTSAGAVSADVDIDPWVVTTAIGYRF